METADYAQQCRNRILLWDVHRESRFARRRAGWFDGVIRVSSLLTSICASAAFASFAGDWPTLGMIASSSAFLVALVCKHFDYPRALADNQELLAAHQGLLARIEEAGGLDMSEDDRRRFAAEYERIGRTLAPRFVAERPLLMAICENEAAACDLDDTYPPAAHIPWWGYLVCQIWPWRWPSKATGAVNDQASPSPAAAPAAEAEEVASATGADSRD